MNKKTTKKSEAAALELEAVTVDLKDISNADLELIYGRPADEVCSDLSRLEEKQKNAGGAAHEQ